MLPDPPPRKPVTVDEHQLAERCTRGRVLLIDDDPEILTAFSLLIELAGYACETFASPTAFLAMLAENPPRFSGPCCVICDVSMPELDGLELQRRLIDQNDAPLILISGSSGIDEAITGFRAGAVDFLVKPIDADALLATIAKALAVSAERQQARERKVELMARMARLTKREREVARLVALGLTNPQIAEWIGLSERTVKFHRQHAMQKLEVETLPELVRLIDATGL